MEWFDKIKKGVRSAMTPAGKDVFLIEKIDEIFSEHWEKISQRTPASVGGDALTDEAAFQFIFATLSGTVHVEIDPQWPNLRIEVKTLVENFNTQILVSDFVTRQDGQLRLINLERLTARLHDLMDLVA